MVPRVIVVSLAVSLSWANALDGITLRSDTVYDQSCPQGTASCGEGIIVEDGDDPPTVLQVVEPARLEPQQDPAVILRDTSILNMSGGRISGTENLGRAVEARDQAIVNVTAGTIVGVQGISVLHKSRINVSGGTIRATDVDDPGLWMRGQATGQMAGGQLRSLRIDGQGHFDITGGSLTGRVIVDGSGILDFSGGSTSSEGDVFAVRGQGTVNIYSGSFTGRQIAALEAGTVNILGGSFEHSDPDWSFSLHPLDGGTGNINVFGSNLAMVDNQITGALTDGTPATFSVLGDYWRVILHEVEGILQAGDANQDLTFDAEDIVQVVQAGKYLTGQPATWGGGDWNVTAGAVGVPGHPARGDGLFDQKDIIAALQSGVYLTGRYAAIRSDGQANDDRTSIIYNADTGEISVDAPPGIELTSINIASAANIFTGEDYEYACPDSLDCNVPGGNVFKAVFGGSFGSISFGNVAQPGLAEDFLLDDLSVIGSLRGGGPLGDVDLIYVPEPTAITLLVVGFAALAVRGASLLYWGG